MKNVKKILKSSFVLEIGADLVGDIAGNSLDKLIWKKSDKKHKRKEKAGKCSSKSKKRYSLKRKVSNAFTVGACKGLAVAGTSVLKKVI